eukprot:Opistho-2@67542
MAACGESSAMGAAGATGPPGGFLPNSPALHFNVIARCSTTRAKVAVMTLPHSVVDTPVFMPVGTQGTLKGITPDQLESLDCRIMLGNTYHLGQRPGPELLTKMGGLHNFMGWNRSLLTDSGGFQMVSLLALAEINEDGVRFQSPHDGSEMLLTPEKSMGLQAAIGADIMMQLDDVVSSIVTGPRVEEAMHRTIRWLDRCIAAHKNTDRQNLFGILQGGLDPALRAQCIEKMLQRDLPGYAIGGLSGGEEKDKFWRVVNQCATLMPEGKPRYLMGVGYAVDLVVCVALGVDMFDCVYPTRTARFGTALVDSGTMQLRNKRFANDPRPIDEACECSTCKTHTRAFLHIVVNREPVACHLVTVHNVAYQLGLMRRIRASIVRDEFPSFVRQFMATAFPSKKYPEWAANALAAVGIDLAL